MTDPISDMLTRIRNAQSAGIKIVEMPLSKIKTNIATVLQDEGYIQSFETKTENSHSNICIEIKYFQGKPVIDEISRVSKPGLRVYKSSQQIPKVLDGLGIAVISTSQGLMTDRAAREKGIGGEIICNVS